MRGRGAIGAAVGAVAIAAAVVMGSVTAGVLTARPAALEPAPAMVASSDEMADASEVNTLSAAVAEAGMGDAATAAARVPEDAVARVAPESAPPSYTRIPAPKIDGPRRVGIQAGHWLTEDAPDELRVIRAQSGTSAVGVREVDINLDVAQRVKAILSQRGIVVDILPSTVPAGYVADAFVSLHGDGDGSGAKSGYKLASSARRTPYEGGLLDSIKIHYGAATGLAYDAAGVTRNMTGYYAFAWWRYRHSIAPHTPSVILEMGFVSNDHDRRLLTERADLAAAGIAEGLIRFLESHPREMLFGKDLLVPTPRFRSM